MQVAELKKSAKKSEETTKPPVVPEPTRQVTRLQSTSLPMNNVASLAA